MNIKILDKDKIIGIEHNGIHIKDIRQVHDITYIKDIRHEHSITIIDAQFLNPLPWLPPIDVEIVHFADGTPLQWRTPDGRVSNVVPPTEVMASPMGMLEWIRDSDIFIRQTIECNVNQMKTNPKH